MTNNIPEPPLEPPEKRDLYYEDKQFFCSVCGKEIAEEQSKFNLCETDEAKAAGRFMCLMHDRFTKDERAFLNWKYDTVEF